MASASLLSPSLRRRGLRTVRHGPETAGRAAFPDGTRNGSSPSSVRRVSASGIPVRFYGPLPTACGLHHPQRHLRTAHRGTMASRHAGRAPFHLLSGPLAAACLRGVLLPCCIRLLAADGMDFPGAGTGASDSGMPLGNPENRLVGPASPLSRFARRVAELPGHAPLVPVSGIPRPDSLVHRHSIPNIQHIQPCRSGTSVFGPGPDAFPARLRLLPDGSPAAARFSPGGPDSAPLHSV